MAYSVDQKEKILLALEKGFTIIEASKLFDVSTRAINSWKKLVKDGITLEPKRGYQKGHSHKIKDLDEFKSFVEKNNKITAKEMIIRWEKLTGVRISEPVIGRYLKKTRFEPNRTLLV